MEKISIDGAFLGLDAERSLKAILGSEEPRKEDMRTPKQMREYLMSAPELCEEDGAENISYGEAARWLAKQYLILLDNNYEGNLWEEIKEKFKGRKILKEFTGFMVGWAENAARYAKGLPEKSNPAICFTKIQRENK